MNLPKLFYMITNDSNTIARAAAAVPVSPLSVVLFGGDRLACVDVAAIAYARGRLVGLATLASRGEEFSGMPTLVGIWVHPAARYNRGGHVVKKAPAAAAEYVASHLLSMIVEYANEHTLLPLQVDPVTREGHRFFARVDYPPNTLNISSQPFLSALPESAEIPGEFYTL